MDPYKVLQVDPEAEDEVVQAAYRRLAQKYHPDVAGLAGSDRMASINAAWELLRDPVRRASYDRERRTSSPPVDRTPDRSAPHPGSGPQPPRGRPQETVSADWASGRSGAGSGYDPARMGAADGYAAAGPPPGNASGSVLTFGRYANWSLGEIARRDIDYVEWLDRMPIGRPYRDEIDVILRQAGRRRSVSSTDDQRRGLFRRR